MGMLGKTNADLGKIIGKLNLDDAFQQLNLTALQGAPVQFDVFYRLIQRCISENNLTIGRNVHCLILRCGYEGNSFLGCHLIRMYAAYGCPMEANKVFSRVNSPDTFTWNAIISAYEKNGDDEEAIALYHKLNASGCSVDPHVLVSAIKACTSFTSLSLVHAHAIECAFKIDMHISITLLNSYAQSGNLEEAMNVFNSLDGRTVVAYNAMIKGYAYHGHIDDALQCFIHMQTEGVLPNHVTFVCIVTTCSKATKLVQGKCLHSHILLCGFDCNITVRNTLIDMYSKCLCFKDAYKVFMSSEHRDVVSWNALIAGNAQQGRAEEAFHAFQCMQQDGIESNEITYSSLVKACCSSSISPDTGKLVHARIIENGLERNIYISNTLVKMYGEYGSVEDGFKVFIRVQKSNLVTWSAMIASYAQNGYDEMAICCYQAMQESGWEPNPIVYSSILKACAVLMSFDLVQLIHSEIIEHSCEMNLFLASALIDIYSKFNSPDDANKEFERLTVGNIVTWSAMISGHAQYGQNEEVLKMYGVMQDDGMEPNEVTFMALVNMCSSISSLYQGNLFYSQIVEMGHDAYLPLVNSLVDMYANNGCLHDAYTILEKTPESNIVTWNALMAGCAKYYDYETAFNCLNLMQHLKVKPNDVTFVSLLSLCNHMGLVLEAHQHFTSMIEEYEILPTSEHYTCLLDLLGRVGLLTEAENILNTMPTLPDIVSLVSLLSHCKTYGNRKLARQCCENIIAIDSRAASGFVQLANIYASDCVELLVGM